MVSGTRALVVNPLSYVGCDVGPPWIKPVLVSPTDAVMSRGSGEFRGKFGSLSSWLCSLGYSRLAGGSATIKERSFHEGVCRVF